MTLRTKFTSTVLSTLVVAGALFTASQPATANASDPDPVLIASLRALAAEFGDEKGRIVKYDAAGATKYFAKFLSGFSIYEPNDPAAIDDTFAFCQQASTGGLTSCEVLRDPDPTAFECDNDTINSWCECTGLFDCINMFRAGVCNDAAACDETGCFCDA